MFTIQTLIAVAVAVGIAGAWTIALAAAGRIFHGDQAPARALRPVANLAQHPTETDDARQLVLH